MFRFIHAADLHLDSPLRGLEQYEGAPVEQIRGATRRALERLVELALEERVAFVLLAGDVFDGDWKDYRTGLFFIRQMARLRDAGIRVFLVQGNHDALNRSMKQLTLPDNVHSFSSRTAETELLEEFGVAIHGRSFPSRKVEEDLSEGYPAPIPNHFNIGLLHTSLDGRPGHDVYAPCTVDGLRAKGYRYWALGHVHQRELVREGDPWIVFPGNMQGRHIREAGSKGCTIVTVDQDDVLDLEHRELSVLRWSVCEVDVTGAADGEEVIDQVRRRLEEEAEAVGGLLLATRVVVTGACQAHAELIDSAERWVNEVRARAMEVAGGEVWVEKVKLDTRAEIDLDAATERDDALGGLLRLIRETSNHDDALLELAAEFDDIRKRLPADLLHGEDPVRLDDPDLLREALSRARDLLVAKLLAGGDER